MTTLNGQKAETTGRWTPTITEYHADTAESATKLKVFAKSPPEYFCRFVTKDPAKRIWEGEIGPGLVVGQGLHAYLEGEPFDSWGVCFPEMDLSTTAGKEEWQAWVKSRYGVEAISQGKDGGHDKKKGTVIFSRDMAQQRERQAGRVILTPKQNELIPRLAESILSHHEAGPLVEADGESEVSVKWEHESGLWVRNRFDRLVNGGPILDFKAMSNPFMYAFRSSVREYAYDLQHALYVEGRWRALGDLDEEFIFIVVGTEPPHETGCYRISREDVKAARDRNDELLYELAACRDRNEWPSRLTGIQELQLRRQE